MSENHEVVVQDIAQQIKTYYSSNHRKKLCFFHGGTNSTRTQQHTEKYQFIDISNLNHVLEINPDKNYAYIEPNVPMDKLVHETFKYNLLPPVVMEFPGITVGGAVNGAALESSSYRYGQFNDICEEYEVILGNGEILICSPKTHPDLFYGITGSYGTLGLLTKIKIKLLPVKEYVQITFIPFRTMKETVLYIEKEIKKEKVDFIDSIIFSENLAIVMIGKISSKKDLSVVSYNKATNLWFYEHAKKIAEKGQTYNELVSIEDYLFRYNRGAFWMAEYSFPILHLPRNRFTKFLINPFINTRKLYDAFYALNISQDYFIQDFYLPFPNTIDFLTYTKEQLGIYPIWLCPIKPTQKDQKLSPHFIQSSMLIDIGIWGSTEKFLEDRIGINRVFEDYAKKKHGRKMLYAHSYYTENEFWKIYDKKWYDALRKKYYATKSFPDIFEKVQVSEIYTSHKVKGLLKLFGEIMKGKNLNS